MFPLASRVNLYGCNHSSGVRCCPKARSAHLLGALSLCVVFAVDIRRVWVVVTGCLLGCGLGCFSFAWCLSVSQCEPLVV